MRRFSVSKTVLLIICLMYLILYVDRVNISTAAPLHPVTTPRILPPPLRPERADRALAAAKTPVVRRAAVAEIAGVSKRTSA
jgi:hypothetical protein